MEEKEKTYKDQAMYEVYDYYDLESGEPVPDFILSAEVLKENKYAVQVQIDYPVIDGIWNLNGSAGSCPAYTEAGKKAFVRDNYYDHPVKGWTSHVVVMSPLDYIEACAELFSRRGQGFTAEDLIENRLDDYDLDKVFKPLMGDLFYPTIDYNRQGQEGLHRAVWAMMNDIENIPVVIIEKT